MKRVVLIALALALAAPAQAAAPSRLLVEADEWGLAMSRQSVRAGSLTIQLVNRGEDGHDLRIRRVGGTGSRGVGEVRPGGMAQFRLKVRRGTYRLWCSLPGHRRAGMKATLGVRS